jgi:Tol biopolymer transport system component
VHGFRAALGGALAIAGTVGAAAIVEGGVPATADATPANGWIAFTSQGVVYLTRAGRAPQPLIVAGSDPLLGVCPSFSPDGTRLMVASGPGHRGTSATSAALVIVSVADDGSAAPLDTIALDGHTTAPCASWSPDGSWAGFVADDSVWLVDTATHEVRELPDHPGATDLEWRPGTDELTVTGRCCGQLGFYSMGGSNGPIDLHSATSGETRRLAGVEANDITWSPDGTTLAYTEADPESDSSGVNGIWLVDADGGHRRRLTLESTHRTAELGITWSPAGDLIAYQRACEGESPLDVYERTHSGVELANRSERACTEVVLVTATDGDSGVPIGTQTVVPPPVTDTADGSRMWFPEGITWAPDGSALLYTDTTTGEQRGGVVAVPVDAAFPARELTRGSDIGDPECCPVVDEIVWRAGQQWGPTPLLPAPIPAGTYRIPAADGWAVANITVDFPPGWTVQYGHVFHHDADRPGEVAFYPVVVDAIYADACAGDEGAVVDIGPTVDELTTALLGQPGATVNGPVGTTVDGLPATRIDLTFPTGVDLTGCSLLGDGLQIWHSEGADKYFVLAPDGVASVYIVDVEGRRQVFLTQYRTGTADEGVRELDAVVGSVRIDP